MLGLVVMGVRDDWLDLFLGWAEQHRYAASISIVTLFIPVALMFVPVDVPLYLCSGFMVSGKIVDCDHMM